MINKQTKNGEVVVYAKTIEEKAVEQVVNMANSPLGENAHIRIMPDAHSGMGCVIGTTMRITDKVCPNLVGVDIGCGVALAKLSEPIDTRLEELDAAIRARVPYGMTAHENEVPCFELKKMKCWNALSDRNRELSQRSMGTLGGGNHFIEAYAGGFVCVHSGSRNIGNVVARYYQTEAEKNVKRINDEIRTEKMLSVPATERETWLSANRVVVDKDLSFLTGELMSDYLHDVKILQTFAAANRAEMILAICDEMGLKIEEYTECIHNYIDTNTMILRKGAISAKSGEKILIPLNMRDGMLVCTGKGNDEWNQSAPHGAGRLYSRTAAKAKFTVDEYERSMDGIFTSCVNAGTLDEAPFAYKGMDEIMSAISETADIVERLIPIFNFKASEDERNT